MASMFCNTLEGTMYNKIISEDLLDILNEDIPWEKFRNSTVVVSGASGILPSYMVETLLTLNNRYQYNVNVIGLVRNIEKAEKRFAQYLGNSALRLIKHDVLAPFFYDGKVDYIIHAAGQASPKFYGADPVGTAEGHVIGTSNMLRFATGKKVKSFLYFSSCAIYGYITEGIVDEQYVGKVDPLDIRSCYPEGKRMGENLCVAYYKQYQVPAKIIRIAHTYGPLMPLDDGRVFTDFVGNILRSEDIQLNSDGSAVRPMLYLSDAVKAYFRVMLLGNDGEAYNIVSDDYISILNLAETLVSLYPDKNLKVSYKKQPAGYLQSKEKDNRFSITKIEKLGWKQKYSIKDGFKRTIESYHI